MRIIRDDQIGTLTFVPFEPGEEEILTSITTILKPEDKLDYGGKQRETSDSKFFCINFYAGAQKETRTTTRIMVLKKRNIFTGGVKLVLRGSTDEDKREVSRIGDICSFLSDGIVFIGEIEVEGKKSIITTATHCMFCNKGIIDYYFCMIGICSGCGFPKPRGIETYNL